MGLYFASKAQLGGNVGAAALTGEQPQPIILQSGRVGGEI